MKIISQNSANRPHTPPTLYLLPVLFLASLRLTAAESSFTNMLSISQRLDAAHLEAMQKGRAELAKQRVTTPDNGLYDDLPAIIYSGSAETPDSLLAIAKKTGIKIILMARPEGTKSSAWRGMHDDVLFIAGSFRNDVALAFPEFDTNGKAIPDSSIKFLSRTDSMAKADSVTGRAIATGNNALPEFLVAAASNHNDQWIKLTDLCRRFPTEFYAAGSDYHPQIFATWDAEAKAKHLTGISVVDDSPKLTVKGVNFAALETKFRDTVTHILARGKTEALVREALTNGHVYVSHDWIANPTGFSFGAINNSGVFGIGDGAPLAGKTRVMAITPVPAHLRILLNNEVVSESRGTNITFDARVLGPCRVEAWLEIAGEERPWIFSNPIYLRAVKSKDSPFPRTEISADVETHKDISYLKGPEQEASKHMLDVYSPKGQTARPVLFFIHGGAWRSGDRTLYPPLGYRYAHEGVVTVIPSYRLAPKYPHPAQIEDVAAAFAWTVEHATEYGGDTNRIYVAGHSAGGHLAALLALDESRLAKYNLTSKIIKGVMAWSGVYNIPVTEGLESVFSEDKNIRLNASPLHFVKPGAPRFIVSYCQFDYFSLPFQARQFYRALRNDSLDAELLYIPDENHLSEMMLVTNPSDPLVNSALRFMAQSESATRINAGGGK